MNAGRRRLKQSAGFTLIEMSVVLVIVGLITGMAMQSGVSVIATARFSATQKKMAAIDQALMAFRNANNRLPCPGDFNILAGATNYGIEAGGGMSCGPDSGVGSGVCTGNLLSPVGTCAVGTALVPAATYAAAGVTNTYNTGAEGVVPTVTLGLPNDFMFDGWGNKFRYAVDVGATASNYFSGMALGCAVGAINVYDATGSTTRSTGSIYALISHGPNGHGAYSNSTSLKNGGSSNANELTNCHCTTGTGTVSAGTYAPTYVQADPTNSTAGNASTAFDDLVTYKERWQMQNGTDPAGSSCAPTGSIYVADVSNHRIEIFTKNGVFVNGIGAGYNGVSGTIGSSGTGNGQLWNPQTVTLDSSGNIWVADSGNYRVDEFNNSGSFLMSIGGTASACTSCGCTASCPRNLGSGSGQFVGLRSVAIDSSGNVWTTDWNNQRVQEFSNSGSFMLSIGGTSSACTYCGCTNSSCPTNTGTGNGQFYDPYGITFDKSGNVWVGDYYNSRLEEFTNSGNYINTISTSAYWAPTGLATDSSGNIWATGNSSTILKYNTSGSLLATVSNAGTASGQLGVVPALAFDSSGNLWMTDFSNIRVVEYNSAGSYINVEFGSAGTANGQFNSSLSPIGIAIGSR